MLEKLIWWWIKGSAIFVAALIFSLFIGGEPVITTHSPFVNWLASFGLAITPVGAVGGYIVMWLFAFLLDVLLSFIGIESKPLEKVIKWTPAKQAMHYSETGNYTGKTTKDGLHYDQTGNYAGKITDEGLFYDSKGDYMGKINDNGLIYDNKGDYKGKVTKEGLMYDDKGDYKGQINQIDA